MGCGTSRVGRVVERAGRIASGSVKAGGPDALTEIAFCQRVFTGYR
jgi:hypothetical protein